MATPRTWRFVLDAIPPGPNDRLHWAGRSRQSAPLRDSVAWQAKAARLSGAPLLDRAQVTITLYRVAGRERDHDNAVATVKPLVDGLVAGGLLVDDSPAHIALEVQQERGACRGVHIVVTELIGGTA